MVEKKFLRRVIETLRWCQNLNEGEMIEVPKRGYCRTYLGFESISQVELDAICYLVNPILKRSGYSFLIIDAMGEIHPIYTIGGK
jgi:hypothetical protein